MNYNTLIYQVIFLIVHLFINFLIVWGVFRMLKKLIGLVSMPVLGAKSTRLGLFISFGITAVFFKSLIADTVARLGSFLIFPINNINIVENHFNESKLSGQYQKGVVFSEFMMDWSRTITESIWNNIININYAGIIIFLTIWALVSLLVKEIEKNINDSRSGIKDEFEHSWTSNRVVRNIFVVLLLTFSIYLSISSIIAVPEFQNLQEENTQVISIEDFSKELDAQKLYAKDNLKLTIDSFFNVNLNNQQLSDLVLFLKIAVEDYNSYLERNWIQDEKAKKVVINKFNAAVDEKIGPKEKIKYKSQLTDWYLSYHQYWSSGMSFQKNNLLFIMENIKEFLKNDDHFITDTFIMNNKARVITRPDSLSEIRLNTLEGDLRYFKTGLYDSNYAYDINQIPDKPQIGEKFGVFNSISGWLLKTESLSLALIVGLFGFGLLGSVGSTFIRKRIKTNNNDDNDAIVIYDLQGILINGISAAIVVFLAVKGAVVIFTTDGNSDNLNPYMLFFTCLVASVFSEDVWSWAKTKLNQNLNGSGALSKEDQAIDKKEDPKEADAATEKPTDG